ncbi:cholecystokinin receptor-like [Haliotis rubra]|uniref:cholecystokinin receptor-like n=1 Tax=Haliotis rubra TaxID=36100 RepID=UPI001EE5A31A|nr:cholecystokinin receptor-like [Haliotis rubra]
MASCTQDILLNMKNMSLELVKTRLEEIETAELPYKVPTFIFLASLLICGIPGNIIVCFVYKFNFPSGPSKSFILGLALFDLQVCFIGVPFEIVDLKTDYFLNIPSLCKIVRFSNTLASAASVLTLLVIAVYRYKKICLPFKKQITMKEVRYAFAGVGISALFISWPALVFYGNQTKLIGGYETTDCSFDNVFMSKFFPQLYQVFLGVLCFIMIGILVVLYTLIVFQIIRQKRRGRALGSHSGTLGSRLDLTEDTKHKPPGGLRKGSKAISASTLSIGGEVRSATLERKQAKHVKRSQTTIMMLLVTVAFIVSYIPHVVLQMTRRLDSGFEARVHCNKSASAAYKLFLRSFFLNSAINPIIYGFYNTRFRRESKRLLVGLLHIRNDKVQVSTASSD